MVYAVFQYACDEDDGVESFSIVGLFSSKNDAKDAILTSPWAVLPFGCYYVKKIPIGRKLYFDIKSMQQFEQHNSYEDSDIDDEDGGVDHKEQDCPTQST